VLFALVMVPRVLSESRMARQVRRIDVPGAVTATGGLVAIVDGLLQAASHPWGSWPVLLPLAGGVARAWPPGCRPRCSRSAQRAAQIPPSTGMTAPVT